MGQCAKACCELPGCDLAWLFERHCYVLSCQRQESCQPRPRPGSDSYVTFVRRGPASPLVLQSLVRGQSYPGRWRPLSRPKGAAAVLRDLALFDGTRDLSDLDPTWTDVEYPDRSLEDDGRFGMEVKSGPEMARTEQKESLGYLDWLPLLGREGLNVTDMGGGLVERESLQDTAQDGPSLLSSPPTNGIPATEPAPSSDPAVSSAAQNLTVSIPSSKKQRIRTGRLFTVVLCPRDTVRRVTWFYSSFPRRTEASLCSGITKHHDPCGGRRSGGPYGSMLTHHSTETPPPPALLLLLLRK